MARLGALIAVAAGLAAIGLAPGAATGADPIGALVPFGVRAQSVSFISPSTGFVLGTAPCAHAPCSVILRTDDRGGHWVGMPAPREPVSLSGLTGVRFADPEHGFAFGHGLWETNDGSASWQRLSEAAAPGRWIVALAPVDDREVVAISSNCAPDACGGPLKLSRRALSGGRWTTIATATAGPGWARPSIAVHGETVWATLQGGVYVSRDGAESFARTSDPCPVHRLYAGSPASITDDGPHTYLLCLGEPSAGSQARQILVTTGAGSGWHRTNRSTDGYGVAIAAGSDHAIVLAIDGGASSLYRSTDGARQFELARLEDDGDLGWGDLGFTTPLDAVVVHGPTATAGTGNGTGGQLLLSDDGGRTWHATVFRHAGPATAPSSRRRRASPSR